VNVGAVNGPGFAYGGPTPEGPKHQIVGVVHAGEFVSTQETLAKPSNRAALEYMHAGGDISMWRAVPPQYMSAVPSQSGPLTALVDPAFVAAVRRLAEAHQATLDNVGVAESASAGSSRLASLGAT
jgi:hypothetical protein